MTSAAWWLWVAVGVAGGGEPEDAEAPDADVVVERTVPVSPATVTAVLEDLDAAGELFDRPCARRWATGVPSAGVGARARQTWTPSWMNRRTTLVVREVAPGARVAWEREGDRGWHTVFDVEAADGGARVRVHAYVALPGWPLKELYLQRIRPAWAECWAGGLDRLPGVAGRRDLLEVATAP